MRKQSRREGGHDKTMEREKSKYDDGEEPSPFDGIKKNQVMDEAKCFNDRELDANRCSLILTKILHLFTLGEEMSDSEVTDIFFSVTKLFQTKDVHLRRLVYLTIKNLPVDPDHALIEARLAIQIARPANKTQTKSKQQTYVHTRGRGRGRGHGPCRCRR